MYAPRTTVAKEEAGITVEVVVLGASSDSQWNVTLTWWVSSAPSKKTTEAVPLLVSGRDLYSTTLQLPEDDADILTYTVRAEGSSGNLSIVLVLPPEGANTVAIV